ncbi:MAG: flagellar biosynthesis protein FlhF [Rhodopirellula sp.]|nr:flagellar biosynthesis protein FlhF [Rhodopirellula sp.]
MDIKTFRASTMHEALGLVRRELGPDAAVLHTREVCSTRFFGLFAGARHIEVTASVNVNVPSRMPRKTSHASLSDYQAVGESRPLPPRPIASQAAPPAAAASSSAEMPADDVRGQLTDLQSMLQELCRRSRPGAQQDLPECLFRLFTQLIDADLSEELARELVERVRCGAPGTELSDPVLIQARIARMIEAEIPVTGPIAAQPGQTRIVALVGPTGVGKTTTIAKLAANYRLKEKRKVGLITVDTYRIAAVEQLRTYADIIDLPMQVVSTPREMREAIRRLDGLDLVLMDTAGRSPRDEIKIRELKSFLSEAGAHEVHLVLSGVASARTLVQTAERFADVGTTALILTKLDEATGLGSVIPLVRGSRLPLSYLTNGQNVPDDIEIATPRRLARLILALDSAYHG